MSDYMAAVEALRKLSLSRRIDALQRSIDIQDEQAEVEARLDDPFWNSSLPHQPVSVVLGLNEERPVLKPDDKGSEGASDTEGPE